MLRFRLEAVISRRLVEESKHADVARRFQAEAATVTLHAGSSVGRWNLAKST